MSRNDADLPVQEGLVNLPTGKPHISFSELSTWVDCSYQHKLTYVDQLSVDDRSHYLDFGVACHASCEHYLRTRTMDASIATDIIKSTWEKYGYAEKEGKLANLDSCLLQAEKILAHVPGWLEEKFPGWRYVDAEHRLYERIGETSHAFKGFIDAVIEVDEMVRGKKKTHTWLLDWKTTTWGWNRYKQQDENRKRQLILYKKFWSQKFNVEPSTIKCGFVLLKRTSKPDASCQLIPVSVGDVTTKRTLNVVNKMLTFVNKGVAIKNRYSCEYCQYKDTPHCT